MKFAAANWWFALCQAFFSNIFSFYDESPDYGTLFLL